jgi:uncharacterized protein YfaS (alpha-2-macroglobulin family)
MSIKRFFIYLSLIFVLMVYTGCRKEDDVPSPTSTADTAVPTSPVSPTPTVTSLGLVSLDNDAALQPKLIGQNPAAGEEAALDGVFDLYFDQPMDEAATTDALQVTTADGQPVVGEISWPQPRILRFKPDRTLKPNSSYQAALSDTAVSATGAPLLEGLTLTFNTIGDLAVSQTSPAPDAEEVAIDSAITVIFNRPVVPLMIAEEQADLPSPLVVKPAINGQGEWINTSVYVFRPDEALIGRQTYTVHVQADVVNELSASGAVMAGDYEWSFTVTAPTIRYLSLVNVTDSPRDGYENLRLNQPFQLFFEQAMDADSTETAVTLTPDNGRASSLDFSWNETRTTLTFTPTQLLELDTAYTLQVADSAQSAQGGRLREGLTWQATTVKQPAIISTTPADGAAQDRYGSAFTINFASPMALDSLKGKVSISPAISGDADGMYDRWDWSLRFYGLAPSTTYTVQILPGMSDPYGNEISQGQTITFTTAPYTPIAGFNFPGRMALYRPGGTTAVWVNYRNVNQLDVDLYRISAQQFGQLVEGSVVDVDFAPGGNSLIWSQSPSVSADLNARGYERFDLFTADGQPLEPGFYFITLDSPQVEHERRHLQTQPLLVATANLTLKTTATEAMIWLTDLNSGQPLADVPVTFYDENFREIFQETTDSDGLIYRDDLTLEAGYQATYYAIAETANVFGMAISGWNDGVRPYDFGIYTDYYLQPGEPTSYIYTDRPIYRPGQPVSFKGIVRLNDDLDYSLSQYETIDVTIHSYDEMVFEEALPLSEFGSFTAEMMLDDEAALGSYRITANADDVWGGSGHFDVAEYRKPTFQVNVNAAEPDVLAGETIDLTVDAQFFSGGSVVNGAVEWSVYAADYVFSAGGNLSRYSFYNDERDVGYYEDGSYNPRTAIASGTGQTDSNGRFTVQIPAELSEESGSRQFTIEATVTDIAENAVSGRTSVIVHRSLVYPGIKPAQYVGQAEKEVTFDVALVDWDENPVPNQQVQVEIVERRWYSVQEENDQGETIWRSTVEEIPVYETNLTMDGRGRGTAVFTPETGGVYRAYVTARDRQRNTAVASTYVWVSGSDYVPWRRLNDNSFELIADADSYQPGDTAEILIASPFQGEAYALVTVERGHIKEYETIRLTDNSTIYRLPITGEMAPNVFVSVMVIKGVDENNPTPDFKVGMTRFTVERDVQELTVEIVPDKTEAGPGDEVTYTVRVSDYNGRPVDAEVSLALADLAALTIAEPNARPILDYFYSERLLSVNTALLLTRLMDPFNQELEDQIKGGGGGDGEFGVLTIREDFPDTAYWVGQLQTGPDGEASVSIILPDNLTTWRMDARAVTLDTKVGQATADIVTTRPLLVNPNTPRFFVQGDTAVLSAAIHNNTDAELEATVTLQAEGVTLNDPASQLVTIPARQQAIVRWEAAVGDVDRVDLVFSAESGPYADATRPTLGTLDGQGIPVYKYEVPETVGTSGQLTEGGAIIESIALPIFPDFEMTEGEVTVEVAPSLAAAMTDGLDYLEHYPYECTEQIVSRFLPNVLTTRALKAAGLSNPALEAGLEEQVNIALQRLYSRQHADGGWPWWDGPDSSTLVTAYVVQALLEARDSGYLVSDGVIDQGVGYLQEHLREVDGLDGRFKLNRQAFILTILARAGQPDAGEVNKLYNQREALDWYARGYLAQAIQLNDPEDPRLATITADFITAAIISATGTYWEEYERDYWNWNTDTRTTAIVLATMIKLDGENPLVANAVRWLMAHRVNGRWASTQETAWTLIALTDWMVASGELEADYQYEIALNGTLRGNGEANADTLRDSQTLKFDIAELFTDELNRLAIGRSDGPGNLYYTAHLQASLPVEQVHALDRGIIISRRYYDPADRETPISEIEQGQTFLARLTVVVPNSLHYVIIEDFLPAGLEAVDTSLKTSQQVSAPQRYDWDDYFAQGWGWWYFDHVELRDEKVVLSANYLPQGTYEYVYLVRASMPGEYRVIPPTAQEFYFPEVYGRGNGALFVVRP